MKHLYWLIAFCALALSTVAQKPTDHLPYRRNTAMGAQPGPSNLPTPAQLAWHETEFYLFFHFGPNTFTNLEWGHGTEAEDLFKPTALDCDQWCRVAKAAGARGVVITAKHHDGFCLWPSQYSTHTVRESPWKGGKGDVLRELSAACKKHGLKFGLYLSPWDRNHPQYGTPEYNDVYVNTLTELLSQYGELFEIWWDGANGEGPNGKKQVYDFKRFERVAARLQPKAVVFSDIGPGCRWAGNEQGLILGETNWCTLDTAGFQRGAGGPHVDTLNRGNEYGKSWIPAECDVSIRPGWFYHAEEDDKVKTPDQLFDIYLRSVGRNANLILNVPPDRRGRIHANDSTALVAFGKMVRARFGKNLAKGRPVYYGAAMNITTEQLTDDNPQTGLNFPGEKSMWRATLEFKKKTSVSALMLQEDVTKGQRVRSFTVQAEVNGQWQEIARSQTIGYRRILTFPAVETKKILVTITDAKAAPVLGEIRAY